MTMQCKIVELKDEKGVFSAVTAQGYVNEALSSIQNDGGHIVAAHILNDQSVLVIIFESLKPGEWGP